MVYTVACCQELSSEIVCVSMFSWSVNLFFPDLRASLSFLAQVGVAAAVGIAVFWTDLGIFELLFLNVLVVFTNSNNSENQ